MATPLESEKNYEMIGNLTDMHTYISPGVCKQATSGDWVIRLGSQTGSEPTTASMSRRGGERFDFERNELGWALTAGDTPYANAQFYNLVHMATRDGLEWTIKAA